MPRTTSKILSKPTGSRPGTSVATTSAAPASSPLQASRPNGNGNVKKGKSPKAKTSNGKSDLEAAARTTEEHLYAPKTKTSYSGQVSRALAYARSFEDPDWQTAFTKISKHTPEVLLAYVCYKCRSDGDGEGLSYKTAEGIKSGMKHYFKNTLGCQDDKWTCDEDGNWTGNPVHDIRFENFLISLKKRDGKAGTSRQSLAVSYSDMVRLMEHLRDPATIEAQGEAVCKMFQAFAATGFTLWTRNEELTRLQIKDIDRGLTTETGSPYFTITLTFRKTNQADVTKANVYQIHPQPEDPSICCYNKLLEWLDWMEAQGRQLQPDDFVFPALDAKGRIKYQEALSQPRIQGWLDQLTNQSGLLARRNGRFTTHCFRRGGAQFRFMFAKEKWSLKAVKWWGGWSEGEGTGTIMRYLLDEYTRYEMGFSDMLAPSRQDSRHAVFMGESNSPGSAPVSVQALSKSLEKLRATLDEEMVHQFSVQKKEMDHQLKQMSKSVTESLLVALKEMSSVVRPQVPEQQRQQQQQPRQPPQPQPQPRQQLQPQPRQQQEQEDEPPVAPRIPTAKKWQDVIKQWEHGDLEKGLLVPLKDWTATMRKTDPTRYSQRKLIALEFIRLGRSERNMRDTYGLSANAIRDLLDSIRLSNLRRRNDRDREEEALVQMVQEADVFEPESEADKEDIEDEEEEEEEEDEEEEEEEEEEKEPLTLNRRRMLSAHTPAHTIAHTPAHSKAILPKRVQAEEPARKSQPEDLKPIKRTYGPVPRVTRSQSVVPTVTPITCSSFTSNPKTPNSAKRRGSNATLLKFEGKRTRSERT
ncbi:hypothetical protein F5H01DRAFT_404160 [Linnemannia elongata]|nr:hypothetical protein F5H01DRAFT_404160 [Linnemannia elongata]